jgi:hypothetical protein
MEGFALDWNKADLLQNGENQFRIGLVNSDEDRWRVVILETGDPNGCAVGKFDCQPGTFGNA